MKFVSASLLVFASYITHAQRIAVLFYDSDWKLTTREESSFYRTCFVDTAKVGFYGAVKDHYKSGKVEMIGKYSNNIKVDTFYYYHPDGSLESKGLYVDNARTGTWKYYHRNGKVKQIIEFLPTDYRLKEYYDSLGNPILDNGSGVWHHEYQLPAQQMWLRIEGEYKNWKRDGKWKVFVRIGNEKEKLDHMDRYNEEELVTPWYSGSRQSAYLPEHRKFEPTEKFRYTLFVGRKNYPMIKTLPLAIDSLMLPFDAYSSFPGGEKELDAYLRKNVKYPAAAKTNGVEDRVFSQFVVDKDGHIRDIRAVDRNFRKDAHGFADEVMRVIQSFPAWTPARRGNKNVAQRLHIYVNFTLKRIEIEAKADGALRSVR